MGEPSQAAAFVRDPSVGKRPGIRAVREPLGHSDVRTTMIDTQVMEKAAARVRSPLDAAGAGM